MDVLTYLMLDYIEKRRGPHNSAADADLAGQELELLFEEDEGRPESHAIAAWATMSAAEKASLPSSVHEWFVERFTYEAGRARDERMVELAIRDDVLAGIVELYFIHSSSLTDLLAVNALLAVDASHDVRESSVSVISRIWRQIAATSDRPFHDLYDLGDLLLDLHFLSRDRVTALRALRQLRRVSAEGERAEQVREFVRTFDFHVRERAEAMGGDEGRELRETLCGIPPPAPCPLKCDIHPPT
jgi:hypothetical protein